MTQMTLISHITPGHPDFGRHTTYHAEMAQWTDHERRLNRIREDLLIAEAERLNRRKRAAAEQAAQENNDAKRAQFWQPILDVLDGPMLSADIAAHVGRSPGAVAGTMRAMEKAGLVTREDPGRGPGGQQLPFIWSRASGRACHIANRSKGEKTRTAVFNLIDGPTTANEIAAKMGHQAHHSQQVLRELERQGRVKRAGRGKKVNGKGSAPTLWVRA